MTERTLADHADYRITLHQEGAQPTNKLVITFGGQPSGLADSGFGTGFCRSRGWDTIYVAQRAWSQYQCLSLSAFEDAVHPVTAGRDVVAYGASLGGYAALYYGGCVDARILAGSPMQSVWPPMKSKKFKDMPFLHEELVQVPKASVDPVIIFDPMREADQFVVESMVLPAYPMGKLVRVPYAGHKALLALQKAGVLGPFVRKFVEEGEVMAFDPPAEGTSTFHLERGKKLARKDKAAARAELERSYGIEQRADTLASLVNLLLRMNELAVAQRLITEAEGKDRPLRLIKSVRNAAISAGLRVAE